MATVARHEVHYCIVLFAYIGSDILTLKRLTLINWWHQMLVVIFL